MDISGQLWHYIIIYKEFLFFTHTLVFKTLTAGPRLRAPKIDTMPIVQDNVFFPLASKMFKSKDSADNESLR